MSRSIFISYRRSDSEGEAGRLSDVLAHRFGEHSVFMDVDAVQPGRDFRKAIEESIQDCAVLLVVIGPDWLEAAGADSERRLDQQNDYVRLEVAAALRRDIPVIPVLIRGARMPVARSLPSEIADLAYRNGVELTHSRWKSDLQILIQALGPHMRVTAPDTSPAPQDNQRGFEPRSAPVTAQATLPDSVLAPISSLLANYIGPIAEIVVRRAATRCDTLPTLLATVADEIESPTDRRRFLTEFKR